MSQSKKRLFVIVIAFLVVFTAGPGACGPVTEIATGMAGPATATPVPTPTEREIRIEGARSRGAVLFQYKGTAKGMAICHGKEQLLSLDGGDVKEFCLTSQETANLSLCQRNDLGNYNTHQDISGVEPGEWLVWGN